MAIKSLSAQIINPNLGHVGQNEFLRNALEKGACLVSKMNVGKESDPVFRRMGVVVTMTLYGSIHQYLRTAFMTCLTQYQLAGLLLYIMCNILNSPLAAQASTVVLQSQSNSRNLGGVE